MSHDANTPIIDAIIDSHFEPRDTEPLDLRDPDPDRYQDDRDVGGGWYEEWDGPSEDTRPTEYYDGGYGMPLRVPRTDFSDAPMSYVERAEDAGYEPSDPKAISLDRDGLL